MTAFPVRHFAPALLAAALGALLASAASPARAQIACADCHEVELPSAAVHAPFGCADCHSDVAGYPHPEEMLRGW